MKTAKQLIKEYLDKGSNMPIEGMALLTNVQCELLMEQYAQEAVKNNFVFADTGHWLLSKGIVAINNVCVIQKLPAAMGRVLTAEQYYNETYGKEKGEGAAV